MEEKKSGNSGGSNSGCGISSLVTLASFGAGGYLGYCHATGMPVDPMVENTIYAAPAVVGGGIGALKGGLVGLLGGGAVGGVAGAAAGNVGGAVAGGVAGGATGGCMGTVIGGGLGAIIKEAAMGIGYALGYVTGKLVNQ